MTLVDPVKAGSTAGVITAPPAKARRWLIARCRLSWELMGDPPDAFLPCLMPDIVRRVNPDSLVGCSLRLGADRLGCGVHASRSESQIAAVASSSAPGSGPGAASSAVAMPPFWTSPVIFNPVSATTATPFITAAHFRACAGVSALEMIGTISSAMFNATTSRPSPVRMNLTIDVVVFGIAPVPT
jgi:hypothetical protein